MGKIHDEIDEALRAFVGAQGVFFVATAPLDPQGHVNCSPKGLDTLRVLGPREIAYLDYAGSGAESIAHVRENGRIVIMLCAFDGPPRIVRFYGRGEVVEPPDAGFAALRVHFLPAPGVRAIVRVDVTRIADSCGFGVPRYELVGQRTMMEDWARRKGEVELVAYQREKNSRSLDGLPALRWTEREG